MNKIVPIKATTDATCGMCLHFKSSAHRQKEGLCSTAGVRSFAPAPSCYTPDVTQLITNTDSFVQLVSLLGALSAKQVKILQSYLRTSAPQQFAVGEQVFLNLRNREYVGNYVRAFVVGQTSSRELILAGDPSNKSKGKVFFAYVKSDKSLLSEKEWRIRLKELVQKGRIVDPTVHGIPSITQEVKDDTYEVPTIDNAPQPPAENSGKKKKSARKDLVEILTL